MRIGQQDDPRKWQGKSKPKPGGLLDGLPPEVTEWPKCECCGMDIKGKKFRVAEGKWNCHRCYNE